MALSLKQLQDVCLLHANDSRKCKYLSEDDSDKNLHYCLKKSSKKSEIDDEVTDLLNDLKKKGINPHSQDMPLGDNCPGYAILRYIKQGYDQK